MIFYTYTPGEYNKESEIILCNNYILGGQAA
jgi:hypothetical protein